MISARSIYHRLRRYRTLQTHYISALPVAIIMPHSACNCRCVICDIWKDNKNLTQLQPEDISTLLVSLEKLGTKQVVLSGGEALLHPRFFQLCDLIHTLPVKITLLSTGLTMARHAAALVNAADEIIVSLDGPEEIHNQIRNIPDAYSQLQKGIAAVHALRPGFPISARSVIHRLNYQHWTAMVDSAHQLGVQQISFLPADTTSHAFNRQQSWPMEKQDQLLILVAELETLSHTIEQLITQHADDFRSGFIAESPAKIRRIGQYYAACQGLQEFPWKKCNAPWVSTVIEADGTIRPCFFHPASGNMHHETLEHILNSDAAVSFRKSLDTHQNPTCARCVCSLYLSPGNKII